MQEGIENISVMNFDISPEQEQLLKTVDRACQKVRPIEDKCYLDGLRNDEVVSIFREANLLGLPISTKYGTGQGADLLTYLLAMERIGQEGCSLATFFSVHISIGQKVIQEWGTEEQKERYLPHTTTGEKIMAFGLTEPDAGSDPSGMKTNFYEDGDYFILNGSKSWISNANIAGVITTYARDKKDGRISAFIVDKEESPFTTQEQKHKMGLVTSDTGQIFFDNCPVPKRNLLGERGKGLSVALSTLMNGRLSVAARCAGVIEDCLKESVEYSKQRETFGKPLAKQQLIQRHISKMSTLLRASKLITYDAAMAKMRAEEEGSRALRDEADKLIAQAKYFATNAAFDAADRAVQVFGANGYSFENRVARHLCDTRVTRIYEGANEILEQKIAISILGSEYSAFR
jgi:alkylation response protein AidB-like acyl-CoA dehydrogenase